MSSAAKWVREAFEHHKAGRRDAAEPLYRKALKADPKSFDALHLLGTLELETGHATEACTHLAAAVGANPSHPRATANLALALHEAGRGTEALAVYDRAVRLQPTDPNLWFNAGNALLEAQRFDDARIRYEKAIALQPNFPEALVNLGHSLRETGCNDEALIRFQQARALRPDFFHAVHNEASMLRTLGRTIEAIQAFQAALEIDPGSIETTGNLGVAMAEMGITNEAEGLLRQAHEQSPGDPFLSNCLGKVLHTAGRFEEAVACYQEAQRGRPPDAEIANNLGTAYRDLGKIDECLAAYRLAVALKPNYESAISNLAGVLLELDELDEHADCCRRVAPGRDEAAVWDLRAATACPTLFDSAEQIADYRRNLTRTLEQFRDRGRRYSWEVLVASHCIPSFNLPFHGLNDRPVKELFASCFKPSFASIAPPPSVGVPKVGFVITHGHETPFLRNMAPFFRGFTPGAFQPVILASPSGVQKIQHKLGAVDVEYFPLSTNIVATVEAIRAAHFDLLYFREIGTDAVNYFLPFFRLAPIQCNTYGIQVTSGNQAVDYYLSSDLIEPPDAQNHYTEKLIRLKTLLVCRDPLPEPRFPRPRSEFGIRSEDHVYLCAQQLGKFHPDFDFWIERILEEDPRGLFIVTEGTHPGLADKLKRRWERALASVYSRIHFVPQQQGEGYTSLLSAADVILDPPHFGGMNTSYDPFSLGKVVVTLPSAFQRGRYTLGCYRAMGIDEPIADSVDDYVVKAVRIAADADYRRNLESLICERRDVLFHNHESMHELQEFFLETIADLRAARGQPS